MKTTFDTLRLRRFLGLHGDVFRLMCVCPLDDWNQNVGDLPRFLSFRVTKAVVTMIP